MKDSLTVFFRKSPNPRRYKFELRDASGAVLSKHDQMPPLIRWAKDKADVCIVRVKDGERVWP